MSEFTHSAKSAEAMKEKGKKTGKQFFHCLNGENIFGAAEVIETPNGVEFFIRKPCTVINGNFMPYMQSEIGASPKCVQIHPINVLWNVPLDEFPEIEKIYNDYESNSEIQLLV